LRAGKFRKLKDLIFPKQRFAPNWNLPSVQFVYQETVSYRNNFHRATIERLSHSKSVTMKKAALVLSLAVVALAGNAEARSRNWKSDRDNYNPPTAPTTPTSPTTPTTPTTPTAPTGTGTTTGSTSGSTSGTTAGYTTMAEVVAGMTTTPQAEAIAINAPYDWQKRSYVIQDAPRGDAIPSWWSGERPTFCYGFQSWYQVFEAQGNAATNTRVQVSNLRSYFLLASTNKWVMVQQSASPYTEQYKYPFAYVGGASTRAESTGISVRPVYPQFQHGYPSKKYAIPNPSDVKAVFTAMDVRLVVADSSKPDDRSKAVYSINVGADFYPDASRMWNLGYAPGVGQGRMIRPTTEWRTATMLVPNGSSRGITYTDLAQLPPPLK
jgi:hypothetical protein